MPSFRAKKSLFVSGGLLMGSLGIAAAVYPFQFPIQNQSLESTSIAQVKNQPEAKSSAVFIPAELLNKTLQGKIPESQPEATATVDTSATADTPRPVIVAPSIVPLEMMGTNENQIVVFRAPDGQKAIGSVGQVIFKASQLECQIKQLDMKNKRVLVLFQGHEHWLSLNEGLGDTVRSSSAGATGR